MAMKTGEKVSIPVDQLATHNRNCKRTRKKNLLLSYCQIPDCLKFLGEGGGRKHTNDPLRIQPKQGHGCDGHVVVVEVGQYSTAGAR